MQKEGPRSDPIDAPAPRPDARLPIASDSPSVSDSGHEHVLSFQCFALILSDVGSSDE